MAYTPKSQIAVKMASPGEYQYKSTGESYIGYYIETNKGIRYAGIDNITLGPEIVPIEIPSNKRHGYSIDVKKFDIMKSSIKKFLSNTNPIPSMKKYPSEIDYTNGFFKRYFAKRINGSGYQEIDKDVFDDIKSKKETYDYNLYEVGNIKWELKGNVFKKNALTLERLERKFKNISYLFPKFDEFAREPIPNQENLYTKGGELYYADSTEYIGAYHIHTTRGPMVGAYHTKEPHPQLYYISELPTPPNTSYEDFMANYPPPTPSEPITPRPSDPLMVDDVRGTTFTAPESYNCVAQWGPPPPGYQGLLLDYGDTGAPEGQIIVGSACVDPGDGTGTYSLNSSYGSSWQQACAINCEGATVNDTSGGNVGCMIPWDAYYCGPPNGPCTIHAPSACASNYTTGGGGGYTGTTGLGYGEDTTGNCFIGKTSIIMEDKTIKRIDEIKIGDIVKSEINTSNVIGIDIHKEKEYTIYSINNSEAFVTAEHPFKTTTGWKAIDPLETFKTHGIESNTLEIGDILITKEGTEEVKSINKSTKTVDTVYNLQLDNEHVYYANGYLVHNNKVGGAWGIDELEEIQNDFGGSFLEQCPCGMFQGTLIYAPCCCDESC